MPRRKAKTEDLRTDTEKLFIENDFAKGKQAKGPSKTAKKKSNKEAESKTASKKTVKAIQKTSNSDEKGVGKVRIKSRGKVGKIKEQASSDGNTMFGDSSVSEYFTVSEDHDISIKSSGGKRKLKTDNSSSFASKIKTLKDGVASDEGSDAEFEAVTVNYRSPGDKKNNTSKKVQDRRKLPRKRVNDGKGCNETDNLFDENIDKKGSSKSKSNTEKEERPDKVLSNRKRKANNLGAASEDVETEVKKPKRQTRGKSKNSKQDSEKNDDIAKKNIRKKSKKVDEVNNNKKAVKENVETDNILAILQQTEGERLENKIASKGNENDSEESSDDEEMMDVEETSANKTIVATAVKTLPKALDHTDAMAVLMHMEGPKQSCLPVIASTSKATCGDAETMSDDDDDATDEDSEWEDVEDHHGNSPKKSQLPSGPVEITLDAPVIYKKRKRGQFDLQAYFKRQINRFKREVAMDIHKVHLLCLVSRCQYLNSLCTDETVQAQALSLTLVTKQLNIPQVKSCTDSHVTQVLSWIREKKQYLTEVMAGGLSELPTQLKVTLICVILLRQVGFLTRLMMSLQPVPFKETSNKKGKSVKSLKNSKGKSSQKSDNSKSSTSKPDTKKINKKVNSKLKTEKVKVEKTETGKDSEEVSNGKSKEQKQDRAALKRRSSDRKRSRVPKSVYKDHGSSDEDEISDDEEFIPDDDGDGGDDDDHRGEVTKGKGKKSGKKTNKRTKTETKPDVKDENISDEDFEEDSILIRKPPIKKEPSRKNNRVLSSDNESEDIRGVDNWAEVYLQREKKWICVDCVAAQVKKPYEIENKATQPVCYVVGISQEGYMRDVTARYASQWLTETRKVRVDGEWWEETLEPYQCPDKRKNKMEDEELNCHLQQRPLPTSVGAFKSHPLYALRRHLLKFEAIYPDSAIPVGYIKGEPVYARECVHTLHSRENWLKEGRAVRIGEEAYKFVKSRPKWNRPKEDPEAKDLELFGHWQTEQYIPPPAVDGKVPRNAHGNVEMFLSSMLPAGTVHLKVPGLNKVAKKLDIDCAPAMVGWDHHCGFSHPQMDGWIVCEEHKDILLAAWDEEQEIIREKEQQKREKRVYDNWRKLIRGMLIKERLKKRFDLEEKPVQEKTGESNKPSEGTSQSTTKSKDPTSPVLTEKADDKKHAWPQNRIEGEQYTLCTVEKM